MAFELASFTRDFAQALKQVDARSPQAISKRSARAYQPGIGPHSEQAAIQLIVAELKTQKSPAYSSLRIGVPYPTSNQVCDLCVGSPPEWAIEVKMARPLGDNGKLDDTWIKDVISPYKEDRSAVTDCAKLAGSAFSCRKSIVIYGFQYALRPLETIIEAFEILVRSHASLGPRHEAAFADLVHPIHSAGCVFAWEVTGQGTPPR